MTSIHAIKYLLQLKDYLTKLFMSWLMCIDHKRYIERIELHDLNLERAANAKCYV